METRPSSFRVARGVVAKLAIMAARGVEGVEDVVGLIANPSSATPHAESGDGNEPASSRSPDPRTGEALLPSDVPIRLLRVRITVRPGFEAPDVARRVARKVRDALRTQGGVPVDRVQVVVAGA